MGRFKLWLKNSNGWQRLWLVLSLCGAFYFAIVNPFVLTKDSTRSRYEYKFATEREMSRAECAPYMTRPFGELAEPPFVDMQGTSGCYHVYNSRRFDNQTTVPYTKEVLNNDFSSKQWGDLFAVSGVGLLLFGILSACVYIAGLVAGWVFKGFRTPRS